MIKTNLRIEDKLKIMSEEGKEIGVDVYDDEYGEADEESSPLEESIEEDVAAQPVEVVREEIVTVAENPNAETFSEERVSMIDNTEDGDLYKLVKAHSVQLNRLIATVESLQSQIKQLKGTSLSSRKTISARRSSMKTKKDKAAAKKTKGKSSKKK
jgi:hypothetical protein